MGLKLQLVFQKTEAEVPMDGGGHIKKQCHFHILDMIAAYYNILLRNTCAYTQHILLRKITVIAP